MVLFSLLSRESGTFFNFLRGNIIMNNIMIIIAGLLSILYFEFEIIPILWLRVLLYVLFIGIYSILKDKRFKKYFDEISNFSNELVKGNYSYKVSSDKYKGIMSATLSSINNLKNKLLKYIFEMQVASNQITAVSQQLTNTFDENNAFAQQLFAEAQELSELNNLSQENINSTIIGIKDVVQLLESVKGTSEQMQNASDETQQIITASLDEIMEIVKTVNDIQHSTNIAVQYVNKLNSASTEIAHILQTVDNIAKQTHLLSLNASIESARAGEFGKGFGVVADEIRTLSEDSKIAVSEISQLLNNITEEISNVTARMDDTLINVDKSVVCSSNVESSLNNIEQSYKNVQMMIQDIINVSEQEYALADSISGQVVSMENISQEVGSKFEILYDFVEKQKENIEDLGELGEHLSNASNSLTILSDKENINVLKSNSLKFDKIINDIKLLIKENILNNDEILSDDTQIHERLLKALLKNNDDIEALWTNDHKGKFICSIPPAGIANASIREWFNKSIQGKEFSSDIYISAITHNPCMTVSLPIQNPAGEYIGVIGVDLKIEI